MRSANDYWNLSKFLRERRCKGVCDGRHIHNFTSPYDGRLEDGTIYGTKYAVPNGDLRELYLLLTKCEQHFLFELRGAVFKFYIDYEASQAISGEDERFISDTMNVIIAECYNKPKILTRIVRNNKFLDRKIHFLFPNVIVSKEKYNYLTDKLKERLPERLAEGVDKTTSGLRMIASRKAPKQDANDETESSKSQGVYLPDDEYPRDIETFQDYSIFNINWWTMERLSVTRCVHELEQRFIIEQDRKEKGKVQLSDEESNQFQQFVLSRADEFKEYELQVKDNNLIQLVRTEEGPCPTTKQVHSRQSAYIYSFRGMCYIKCFCDAHASKAWERYRSATKEDKKQPKYSTKFIDEHIRTISQLKSTENYPFNITNLDDRYVRSISFPTKCVCIKAGLGLGKTTSYIEYLNRIRPVSVLVLTPRISFAQSIFTRLIEDTEIPFVLYKESSRLLTQDYIICQTESLYRLKNQKFSLVIADEIESILYQLTSISTHGKKFMDNYYAFEQVLQLATNVLCLDAFLSNRTVRFMMGLKLDLTILNYTRILDERKVQKTEKIEELISNAIRDLKENKKLYLFCSSKKKLVNTIIPTIQAQVPLLKYQAYHADNKIKIKNVDREWVNYDLVCTTSTTTVGLNFTANHFHKVYVYASGSSRNLVRDIIQSTYRVRHLIDNTMVVFIDPRHNGVSVPFTKKRIEEDLSAKLEIHERTQMAELGFSNVEDTPEILTNLYIYNLMEQSTSIMQLDRFFTRYLKLCNYQEIIPENLLLDLEKMITQVDIPQDYDDIAQIGPDTACELNRKRFNETVQPIELAQLEKFYFSSILLEKNPAIKKDLWPIFLDNNKTVFRNLTYEKGLQEGTVEMKAMAERSLDRFAVFTNLLINQLHIIHKLKFQLGISNTRDFITPIREDIIRATKYLMTSETRTVFNIKTVNKNEEPTTKNIVHFLNQILSRWSKSKIVMDKQIRDRVNGKRVSNSIYKCRDIAGTEHDIWSSVKGAEIRISNILRDTNPIFTGME